MRGLLALGLTVLLSVALPRTAAAWTDATVRTARAEVELLPDGRAHVTMWARVRVDGGWLEGLELEGLDVDATLDPERPLVFRDASGVALAVQVTPREDGRVSLRFTRRMAPRRGEYEIELAWTTALSTSRFRDDGEVLEARWVFPAWRYGLDAVEVRWHVPAEATPQPDGEITAPIETELGPTPSGDGRTITYRRAHLPRTSDWETMVLVPASAWPHVVAAGASMARDARETGEEPTAADAAAVSSGATTALTEDPTHPADATSSLLAALVAVSAWLKRRDLELRARRVLREARFLVPAPGRASTLASASLVTAVAVAQLTTVDAAVLVALAGVAVALSWQRSTQGAAMPRLSALAPVSSREIVRARRELLVDWVAPAAWLEPTRLGLASVLAVGYVVADADGSSRALAALFAALVAGSSRTRLGTTPGASLRTLSRAMDALRVEPGPPHVSVRLLARGSTDPSDARIHLSLSHAGEAGRVLEGLRAELVPLDGAAESLCLRVSAFEGTAAEDALRAWAASQDIALAEVARRPGVRVRVHAGSAGRELDRVVRGVLAHASREEDRTLPDPSLAEAAE